MHGTTYFKTRRTSSIGHTCTSDVEHVTLGVDSAVEHVKHYAMSTIIQYT